MKMRDRMLPHWIPTHELRTRLTANQFLLWVYLWFVCDDFGVFEANAALLRAVLYARALDRVSEKEVNVMLQVLHTARGVRLYTVKGAGYGKVIGFEQPGLRSRKREHPDEEATSEPDLFASGDPPEFQNPSPQERKKEDVSEGAPDVRAEIGYTPPRAAHTHTPRKIKTIESEKARLRAAFPDIDLEAEIARATAYVHRVRGVGAKLTVSFFEEKWLPKSGGPSLSATAPIAKIVTEPEYWREFINDEFPNSSYAHGGTEEGKPWKELPSHVRDLVWDARRNAPAEKFAAWLRSTGRNAA